MNRVVFGGEPARYRVTFPAMPDAYGYAGGEYVVDLTAGAMRESEPTLADTARNLAAAHVASAYGQAAYRAARFPYADGLTVRRTNEEPRLLSDYPGAVSVTRSAKGVAK